MTNKSKFKRCTECDLHIRCRNQGTHDAGFHHKNRLKTMQAEARAKAKGG